MKIIEEVWFKVGIGIDMTLPVETGDSMNPRRVNVVAVRGI